MPRPESYKLYEGGTSKKTSLKVTLTIIVLIIIAGVVGIVAWQVEKSKERQPNNKQTHSNVKSIGPSYLYNNLTFTIKDINEKLRLNGQLFKFTENESVGMNCSGSNKDNLCLIWPNDKQLEINYINYGSLQCYAIMWTALQCNNQVFRDCYELTGAHWYGGFTDWNQYWPIERTSRNLTAFVPADYLSTFSNEGRKTFGGVLERYFINSKGVGININQDVPLYISINETGDQQLCLVSKFEKYPYFNIKDENPKLTYRICMSDNVRKIHDYVSIMTFVTSIGIPDKQLFKYPIWSTWAQYHKDINQTSVIDFAKKIVMYNFSYSQLEIDDDWTLKYGDLNFNINKFPNASEMIQQLNQLGFRVTLWVHPFCNIESNCFQNGTTSKFLVKQFESDLPALVSWWDGKTAGLLDVSNPEAVRWFLNELQYLKSEYNISSFKFDAGESTWLPNIYQNSHFGLNFYAKLWARLAFMADTNVRHQEVRVGVQSQLFPMFVRMLDKTSNWGYENGLKTLIPTALTYGILGYPFILPDMIGGNAYIGYPDRELYIRWLEATALFPSMQFSIPPWNYDDEVIRISQKFDRLHQTYSDKIIKLAEDVETTRSPIIRPLWWISPEDEEAQITDSEFLLGDDVLVAPVLDKGALSRDIYLPSGSWRSNIDMKTTVGPIWLRNYSVNLDDLPIFTKVN